MSTNGTTSNGFGLFASWLKETWVHGRGCAILWIYFVIGILLFGGAGFWLLAIQTKLNLNTPDILLQFCSFTPAVAGASCMDFIFGEDEKRYLRGFSILFGAVVLVLTVLALIQQNYFYIALSTLLSLSIWWLANAKNPRLSDVAKPLAAVGGDVTRNVDGNNGGNAL